MHFNSIKVRLEQSVCLGWLLASLFQFHKGTIRTTEQDYLFAKNSNFNSIKVRLEPSVFHLNYKLGQ